MKLNHQTFEVKPLDFYKPKGFMLIKKLNPAHL